ncbi:hypothetical protein Hs30E_20410 [Lactococcus hodotermopsidis]|uniref:SpaA-like prealbumin fold domain-containing protein n=1 Tax=Pseudolactococcus hodotermopsidis TaxID=2709157 RepID=A0A6A0BDM4_9LACT|nr:prealbumin-like fold domain-containing protein [Lactococcus hodotermopsidis]GFH43512.1 hypothetical protein Hs30E_20410 [Lactococcus hodotermopsidis]
MSKSKRHRTKHLLLLAIMMITPIATTCFTENVKAETPTIEPDKTAREAKFTDANELATIELSVRRLDERYQLPLPGAVFALKETMFDEDETIGLDYTEGTILVTGQQAFLRNQKGDKLKIEPDKDYYLKEIFAPLGYRNLGVIYKIHTSKDGAKTAVYTLDKDGNIKDDITHTYKNEVITFDVGNNATYNVELFSVDKNSAKALAGAEFDISTLEVAPDFDLDEAKKIDLSQFKDESKTVTFDADGKISYTDIPRGTLYKLTQTKAPKGYRLNKTSLVFFKGLKNKIIVKHVNNLTGQLSSTVFNTDFDALATDYSVARTTDSANTDARIKLKSSTRLEPFNAESLLRDSKHYFIIVGGAIFLIFIGIVVILYRGKSSEES